MFFCLQPSAKTYTLHGSSKALFEGMRHTDSLTIFAGTISAWAITLLSVSQPSFVIVSLVVTSLTWEKIPGSPCFFCSASDWSWEGPGNEANQHSWVSKHIQQRITVLSYTHLVHPSELRKGRGSSLCVWWQEASNTAKLSSFNSQLTIRHSAKLIPVHHKQRHVVATFCMLWLHSRAMNVDASYKECHCTENPLRLTIFQKYLEPNHRWRLNCVLVRTRGSLPYVVADT